MNKKLDDECARRLGWHLDERGAYWHDDQGGVVAHRSWSPSTNHSEALLLENEIARRGLEESYCRALTRQLYDVLLKDYTWALIRATPEQRARAFLEAMEA